MPLQCYNCGLYHEMCDKMVSTYIVAIGAIVIRTSKPAIQQVSPPAPKAWVFVVVVSSYQQIKLPIQMEISRKRLRLYFPVLGWRRGEMGGRGLTNAWYHTSTAHDDGLNFFFFRLFCLQWMSLVKRTKLTVVIRQFSSFFLLLLFSYCNPSDSFFSFFFFWFAISQ